VAADNPTTCRDTPEGKHRAVRQGFTIHHKTTTMLVKCKQCGCYVETDYGKDAPAEHLDAAGTREDPRSPGDHDDVCDVCDYGSNR